MSGAPFDEVLLSVRCARPYRMPFELGCHGGTVGWLIEGGCFFVGMYPQEVVVHVDSGTEACLGVRS